MPFKVVEGMRTIEFGNPGKSRETLVNWVFSGTKQATAGLLKEYQLEGEHLETVGERLGILDNDGKMVAVVEATRVELLRFADVPDEFALAEGEGDLNAQDFRDSHLKFWSAAGDEVTDDTMVVTLYFKLIETR
jgi:uncharacterized protein YhfF